MRTPAKQGRPASCGLPGGPPPARITGTHAAGAGQLGVRRPGYSATLSSAEAAASHLPAAWLRSHDEQSSARQLSCRSRFPGLRPTAGGV
jgi:hypothetical protein